MRAIVQHRYGSPDVLALEDVDRPSPGDGEVLVRIHAAGLDRGVWHLMTGLPYLVRFLGYGLTKPRIPVPGMDLAGTVEAVGKGVTRFRPGDEVFGACDGSFAEYGCTREARLGPKPAGLSFEEAAAVPTSGLAALQAAHTEGKVQEGQEVLVIGASGGVGTFLVQVARAFGAEVTGVCSASKMDLVRSLGVSRVIDYAREDPVDGRHRYDVVFDLAGNRPLSRLRRALKPGGTLVIVGGEEGGRWFGGLERQLGATLLSPFVGHTLRAQFPVKQEDGLERLTALVESGEVRPVVDRAFPLAEAPDAIRYMTDGRPRGKVVILP